MATYIIDASVIIDFLITGQYTREADNLLTDLEHQFVVPEFCLTECTNVLWKRVRFSSMPQKQAIILLRDLRHLPLKRAAIKSLLKPASEIGLANQLAVYDSIYIALAQRSDTPLITIDVRQQNAAIALGVPTKLITDFV